MARIFKDKFFSAAGQKERLTNVVQTVKSAVTLKGVQSNVAMITEKNNVITRATDKVLSAAASNPYATAAVTTAVIKAPQIITAIKGSVGSGSVAVAGSVAKSTVVGQISKIAAAGAVGYVAGSFLSGSRQTTTQTPTLTPTQDVTQMPTQTPTSYQTSTQDTYNINYGSGSIASSAYQTPTTTQTPTQILTADPQQSAYQDTGSSQDAGSTNWGTIALIALGAYFITR